MRKKPRKRNLEKDAEKRLLVGLIVTFSLIGAAGGAFIAALMNVGLAVPSIIGGIIAFILVLSVIKNIN